MDILNIVFSALNLLATVIIGVINVTWMISRDVFRDKPVIIVCHYRAP